MLVYQDMSDDDEKLNELINKPDQDDDSEGYDNEDDDEYDEEISEIDI